MLWVVVDVGCIECGAESGVVGVFTDRDEAARIAGRCGASKTLEFHGGGEHEFNVYPVSELDVVEKFYLDKLEIRA